MRTRMAALFCALLLAACASIVKGTTQVVAVTTPRVTGALCTLNSPSIGSKVVITPGTITLEKSKYAVTVNCTKECYEDGAGIIASNFEGMSAGNIVLGGVIGLGVDAATGAMNQYTPEIQVIMMPKPGCHPGAAPAERRGPHTS